MVGERVTEATVRVVDDDDAMRAAICRMLLEAGYAVESYGGPRELLDRASLEQPGCIVLDLHMPEMTGIELQERLGGAASPLPVVFVSGHGDVPSAVQAMKAGAVDFLPKPFRAAALLEAVARAVDRDRTMRAARDEHRAAHERYATLSPQEERVCRLVARGLLNKQIAAELGLAEQTVRVYRGRMMEKLGIDSVAALMQLLARVDREP